MMAMVTACLLKGANEDASRESALSLFYPLLSLTMLIY